MSASSGDRPSRRAISSAGISSENNAKYTYCRTQRVSRTGRPLSGRLSGVHLGRSKPPGWHWLFSARVRPGRLNIVISFGSFLGVSALSLGMVLTPGPNMMYVVSRSISQGRRAGLISLGGVGLGFIAYIAATTLGLSALFVAVP